jgi:probable rRNA maturation factor
MKEPPPTGEHDLARWEALARAALIAEGADPAAELSLTLVDEDEMAELNHAHMGHVGPTDVLSFPLDYAEGIGAAPAGGEIPPMAGDIVICPAVARRNAPDHAGTVDDELALLVVHGVLHLLGHDHAEPGERAAMQARERALLEALHGPLAADPWHRDQPNGARA